MFGLKKLKQKFTSLRSLTHQVESLEFQISLLRGSITALEVTEARPRLVALISTYEKHGGHMDWEIQDDRVGVKYTDFNTDYTEFHNEESFVTRIVNPQIVKYHEKKRVSVAGEM